MQPCIAGLLCAVSWRDAGLVGSDCSEWKKPEILMYAVAAQPAVSFPSGQGLGRGTGCSQALEIQQPRVKHYE